MRILVTAPHRGAGYAIASSLRPHCERLVAVVARRRPSFARSRLYDRTVTLPPPSDTWIGAPTAPAAQAHAARILDLCAEERIDAVWPSNDGDLFVLSAAKDAFARAGTAVMAPGIEALRRAADKYTVIEAARSVGFPVADAALCTDLAQVERALEGRGMPVVIKGRWSTSARAVTAAPDRAAAIEAARRTIAEQGEAIVQDFIRGDRERSLHYLLDRDGRVLRAFGLRKMRHLAPSWSTSIEVVPPSPELEVGARLLHRLGLTGFCVIQTRIDAQDGRCKLVEINARFGANSRILFALGGDLALAATCAALGRDAVGTHGGGPASGARGAAPIEDVLSLWSLFLARLQSTPEERATLPRVAEVASALLAFHRARPRVDLHTRALLTDPLAAWPYFLGLVRLLAPTPSRLRGLRLIPWGER